MQTRLFLISQHIQYTGCAFLAQGNKAFLTFPTFIINVHNTDKFKIQVSPDTNVNVHFDEEQAKLVEEMPDHQKFKVVTLSEYIPSPDHWQQEFV